MYPENENKETAFVVIPAMNEQSHIGNVINKTLGEGFNNIIVVDDASTDDTKKIAQSYPNVTVLSHVINLGPGASTYTGIKYAISRGAKVVLTIDADNQHDPKDLTKLVTCIYEKEADMVIGSRFLQKNKIPSSRIFYNKVGNLISFFVTGVYLSDSQSGIKALSRNFAKKLNITHNGFEFCIEIIKQAKINKVKISEEPVNVRYSKSTMQKGQNLATGIAMVAKLLKPF